MMVTGAEMYLADMMNKVRSHGGLVGGGTVQGATRDREQLPAKAPHGWKVRLALSPSWRSPQVWLKALKL